SSPFCTRATGSSGRLSITRAPVAYALTLNGFSPFSSRRKAISSRTAAISRLVMGAVYPGETVRATLSRRGTARRAPTTACRCAIHFDPDSIILMRHTRLPLTGLVLLAIGATVSADAQPLGRDTQTSNSCQLVK